MTNCEKTETLARWMGYEIVDVESPVAWRGIVIHDTNPTILGERNYWWNPLHNIADAMEIYEHAGALMLCPTLTYHEDDMCEMRLFRFAPKDRITLADHTTVRQLQPTIPAAICEAMVEWLEEKGE